MATTTETSNAKQTAAEEVGTSLEITKKPKTTEDATTSRVTSTKRTASKDATTSEYSPIMTQKTLGATTSVARTTIQTTEEGPSTAAEAISTVMQGRSYISDNDNASTLTIDLYFL